MHQRNLICAMDLGRWSLEPGAWRIAVCRRTAIAMRTTVPWVLWQGKTYRRSMLQAPYYTPIIRGLWPNYRPLQTPSVVPLLPLHRLRPSSVHALSVFPCWYLFLSTHRPVHVDARKASFRSVTPGSPCMIAEDPPPTVPQKVTKAHEEIGCLEYKPLANQA